MTLPPAETYLLSQEGGVLTVTLNRPERLNALGRKLQEDLTALWPAVAADPEVRCVVVTGAGRAFSAGADTEDLSTATRPDANGGVAAHRFCPGHNVEVPVILAVNGMCVGGGLNFLADADIALAARSAFFTDPHVTMGQVSGPEVLALAARTSVAAVAPLALCGSKLRITAERAREMGLVSEVVDDDQLLPRALELAAMICAQSPTAIRETLRLLRAQARAATSHRLDDAWAAVVRQWSHPDAMEGPKAFLEKRPAQWAVPVARS